MSRNCQRAVNSFGDLTAVQARFEGQGGWAAKKRSGGQGDKPDPVRRASKFRPARRDDHSSSPAIARGIKRPTRGLMSAPIARCGLWLAPRRAGTALPSYLALLHAGFAVPPLLPTERWALTPPFHPYQMSLPLLDVPEVFLGPVTEAERTGGLFSVALSVAR